MCLCVYVFMCFAPQRQSLWTFPKSGSGFGVPYPSC